MQEYSSFHVARHVAKHAFELDDEIYGAPLEKTERDWTLDKPELYLQRLKTELQMLEIEKGDLEFVLRSKYRMEFAEQPFNMTEYECDSHIYHKFHNRSFTYCQKISFWLQSSTPEEIEINLPKARRQLNVLNAAIQDVNVSIVRYTKYINSRK